MGYSNSSTNTLKGVYNETKVVYYLEGLSGAKVENSVELVTSWPEILCSLPAQVLDFETERAFELAKLIMNYVNGKLGWEKVHSLHWTSKTNHTSDDLVVRKYCSYKNPADIVLQSNRGEYLGVSLKSYSSRDKMNHKETSFTTIDPMLDNPYTKEEAFKLVGELIEKDSLLVAKNVVHLSDLNYIHAMALGKYHKTRYEIHEGFSEIESAEFEASENKTNFALKINHENGFQRAKIYFKKANYAANIPRYVMQVDFVGGKSNTEFCTVVKTNAIDGSLHPDIDFI